MLFSSLPNLKAISSEIEIDSFKLFVLKETIRELPSSTITRSDIDSGRRLSMNASISSMFDDWLIKVLLKSSALETTYS